MELLELNHDVLDSIVLNIASTGKDHLIAAMQTCRMLYDLGIPYLLRKAELYDDQKIVQFACLILRNPTYARHIRAVTLCNPTRQYHEMNWNEPVLNLMADVFPLCVNLQKLSIGYAEAALSACPRLATSLEGCKTIRSLTLGPCHDAREYTFQGTSSLVMTLRTVPLRTLALAMVPMNDVPPGVCTVFDALSFFAGSLEVLYLYYADLTAHDTDCTTFPRVTQLVLHSCDVSMAVVERVFPNVRKFTVEDDEEGFQENVEHNQDHECTVWRRMDELSGDALGLGGMVLRGCHAGCVSVVTPPYDAFQANLVLRTVWFTQPHMFVMEISDKDDVALIGRLAEVPTLRMLYVKLSETWPEPTEILDVLSELPGALSGFRHLNYLRIYIHGSREKHAMQEYSLRDRNAQENLVQKCAEASDSLGLVDVEWTLGGWRRALYRTVNYSTCTEPEAWSERAVVKDKTRITLKFLLLPPESMLKLLSAAAEPLFVKPGTSPYHLDRDILKHAFLFDVERDGMIQYILFNELDVLHSMQCVSKTPHMVDKQEQETASISL